MSKRRRAEILLPSPLGLVAYDVLEDTTYVGPGPRGGLTAAPNPFPRAVVVLSATERGLVARPLPGEAEPRVNGEPAGDRVLEDGDRVEIGAEVLQVRGLAPAAPARTDVTAPPDEGQRPRGRGPLFRRPWWVHAIGLAGGLALLAAVALAVNLLSQLKEGEKVVVSIPPPPEPLPGPAHDKDAAGKAYDQVLQWENEHPDDPDRLIARWHDFVRAWPDRPEAGRAQAHIREIVERAAQARLDQLEKDVGALVPQNRFNTALAKIREYERIYGATESGRRIEQVKKGVRDAARRALDDLLRRVGPRVASDPRGVHRELLAAGPEFPPDLAAEITDLMERALDLMQSQGHAPLSNPPGSGGPGPSPGPVPGPPPAPGPGPGPTGPGTTPPTPSAAPPDGAAPTPPAPATEPEEAQTVAAWKAAHDALVAGRYADAFQAYTVLIMTHGNTDAYRHNKRAISAGRYAAKVGAEGAAALLSVPAHTKHGKIEVEYGFDDPRVVEQDFSIEQPFPSEQPMGGTLDHGTVRLTGTSGLFHLFVWSPDVHLEADVDVEVAHDVGALAVENADELRAIVLSLANRRFGLKKTANRIENPGHVLWFMGQGAWSTADPDAVGYIKIAERGTVKLENGQSGTIELTRTGDRAEAGFHGKSENVSLKGTVRGDDGKGMGAARVGLFANTGVLVVRRVRISGTVDEAWFKERLKHLVEDDPGP